MKTPIVLLIAIMLLAACSSPKKTPAKSDSPKVTRADILLGGTSFNNPVIVMVQTESAGMDEEYKWLSNSYPGYALIRRTHTSRSNRQYDIVRIKTKQGQLKDIYFDSTRFWGKN
jgi:hypothetical protein